MSSPLTSPTLAMLPRRSSLMAPSTVSRSWPAVGVDQVDVGDVVPPGDDPDPAVVGAALGVGGHLGDREVVEAVVVEVADRRHREADVAAARARRITVKPRSPIESRVRPVNVLGAEDHVGLLRGVVADGEVVEVVAVDVARRRRRRSR